METPIETGPRALLIQFQRYPIADFIGPPCLELFITLEEIEFLNPVFKSLFQAVGQQHHPHAVRGPVDIIGREVCVNLSFVLESILIGDGNSIHREEDKIKPFPRQHAMDEFAMK